MIGEIKTGYMLHVLGRKNAMFYLINTFAVLHVRSFQSLLIFIEELPSL